MCMGELQPYYLTFGSCSGKKEKVSAAVCLQRSHLSFSPVYATLQGDVTRTKRCIAFFAKKVDEDKMEDLVVSPLFFA